MANLIYSGPSSSVLIKKETTFNTPVTPDVRIGGLIQSLSMDENANIMVRSGMHCTHYYHQEYLKSSGTVRASLYLYNTKQEIEYFFEKLEEVTKHF